MLQNFGTALSREQMRMVKGGVKTIGGTCTSTCWDSPVGGEELGDVTVSDCDTHAGDCKTTYPNAVKATCSCG